MVEALRPKAMTASARGTAERQGRNVAAKAGLNREIQATGWGALRRMLEYKATRVIPVDPAWTPQTRHACGAIDARPDIRMRGQRTRRSCGRQCSPQRTGLGDWGGCTARGFGAGHRGDP